MIISISGLPGSGKSTVAKILAEKLDFERISAGNIQRKIADQKGISILELLKEEETDSSIDEEVDRQVADLGRIKDNFIIESRTAFHFIPESFKIFVKVDLREGARRIFKDLKKEERKEEGGANTEEKMLEKVKERAKADERYKIHYGIDYTDESNYDMVIDSTKISPDEVAERIMAKVERIREKEEENSKNSIEEEIS